MIMNFVFLVHLVLNGSGSMTLSVLDSLNKKYYSFDALSCKNCQEESKFSRNLELNLRIDLELFFCGGLNFFFDLCGFLRTI